VLRVGRWHGRAGQYQSIQAAVDAARPGDWILIAPGDYHESPDAQTGVHITTPDLHLRGLERDTVIIDGDRPGAPRACDPEPQWQNLRANGRGRDGIVVDHANNLTIENLTVCNFVGAGAGRQIEFDGGTPTGPSRLGAFRGAYLTATDVSSEERPWANDGISITNTSGPGTIVQSFASNMANSAFHIGACQDCNTTFDDDIARHSAIGLTAIDAGGRLVVTHSTFVDNSTGIDLASEQDESSPPPQDGACPPGQIGPVAQHPHSCTIITHNVVRANNDPNVPGEATVLQFIGAGIVVAGGRTDTIVDNAVTDQGSYGIIVTVYPWTGPPASPLARCQGGRNIIPGQLCLFDAYDNAVAHNTLSHNGSFGNPTNGDHAQAVLQDGTVFGRLGVEIACATQVFGPCDGSTRSVIHALKTLAAALHERATALDAPDVADLVANYPRYSSSTAPAPPSQPSMPSPCQDVPASPWC
jgi:hypothetical protein